MIDSHAHLTNPQLLEQVEELLQRAFAAGVEKIVNICTDASSLKEGLELQKMHTNIFNTAATTPHDVAKEGESFFPLVEQAAHLLVAIGETGLDYFYEHSPKKTQQEFLSRYLELAKKCSLPIIFHCREAFEDLFAITDQEYKDEKAVLHCFTGTKEEAKGVLERGWMVSFSGIITFKKSETLREVVKYVPLDQVLIETDSPYLAPQKHRGGQNEPAFLSEVALKIAQVKGISLEEVAFQTRLNTNQLFSLRS